MKKSLSKKILAMLLAVLMLATSVPLAAFAADDSLTLLKASINQYLAKMDGSLFTNMSNAYDAYLTAQKYADAYEYGTKGKISTEKLDEVRDALEQAASLGNYASNGKMVKFDFRPSDTLTFTYPKWSNANDADNQVSQSQSRNVLYAGTFSVDESASGESADKISGDNCPENGADIFTNNVYYGNTVLLYDGKKEKREITLTSGQKVTKEINPRFPVIASVFNNRHLGFVGWARDEEVWMYSIAPSNGLAIQYDGFNSQSYNASQQSKNYQIVLDRSTSADPRFWAGQNKDNKHYADNYNSDHRFISGECARQGDHDISSDNIYDKSKATYYASTLEFYREMPDTEYTTTEYLGWIFFVEQTGWKDFWDSRHQWLSWGTTQPSKMSTNVINYVAVEKLFTKLAGMNVLVNPQNYLTNENKVKAVMSAVDSMISVVSGIDKAETYAANPAGAVATINTNLTNINTAITNASTLKTDGEGYANVKGALKAFTDIYNEGNDIGTYTADSWAEFEVAYGLAQEHMTNLPQYGYTGADTLAENLQKAGTESKTPDVPHSGLVKEPSCNASEYILAKDALEKALASDKLSASSLKTAAEMLNGKLEFWNVTDWSKVPATRQEDVNAEAQLLRDAAAELIKLADDTNYKLILASIETLNADSINFDKVKEEVEAQKGNLTREVEVLGVKYTGYAYDDVTTALKTAITENMYWYTVKMYDADGSIYVLVKEKDDEAENAFPYGLGWIEEDGTESFDPLPKEYELATYHYNTVLTLDSLYGYECDWSVSACAEKTNVEHKAKYIGTGSSCTFVVRGNTKLYLSEVMDEDERYESRVTFVNSTAGEVLDFGYTFDDTFDMSNVSIPNRAFYTITDYICEDEGVYIEDGVIYGIPEGSDVTIKVVYTPVTQKGVYRVHVMDAAYNNIMDEEFEYNDYVELVGKDTINSFKKVNYNSETKKYETECYLSNTSTYSFYACEDITIIEDVNEAPKEIGVNVVNAPVITNGRAFFVGSFGCVPEGCEVISAGVVLDINGQYPDNLSLAKVDGDEGVLNMSAAKIEKDTNQFVLVYSNAAVLKNINYVAYVIYSDGSAMNKIAYSTIKSAEL